MYTLYVCAGLSSGLERKHINKVLNITQDLMPEEKQKIHLKTEIISEINGGFFLLTSDVTALLFNLWATPELQIIFYGYLYDSPTEIAAKKIGSIWKQGGVEAVHRLNGLFSAIIIDRTNGQLHLVSDAIGSRTCRYRVSDDEAIHISTNDIPLVAAGDCSLDLDHLSIASSLSYDWSVGGNSFLKEIKIADPFTHLTWSKKGVKKYNASTLFGGNRIESIQDPQFNFILDEMVELLCDAVRHRAEGFEKICVDLTAGLDSRAILAVALNTVGPSRTLGRTNGAEITQDAKLGRLLANRTGIDFMMLDEDTNLESKISGFSDAVGFGLNGDYSSKSVWLPSHTLSDTKLPHICGAGGEIFRGFYYPTTEIELLKKVNPVHAVTTSRFDRSSILPWNSGEIIEGLRDRVSNLMFRFKKISPFPSDILDLYYTHERVAHWGVHQERHPLRSTSFSPFKQPSLARLEFQLPPGIGAQNFLHAEVINRFSPQLKWILINGTSIVLPIDTSRSLKLRQSFTMNMIKYRKQLYELIPWRLRQYLRTDPDIYMSELFNGPLKNYTYDSLLSSDSIALLIFKQNGIEKILNDHMEASDHAEELGLLLTMNSWFRQVKRANDLSKKF